MTKFFQLQKVVLFLVNNPIARMVLRVPSNKRVVKITNNSVHYQKNKKENVAVIYSRPVFKEQGQKMLGIGVVTSVFLILGIPEGLLLSLIIFTTIFYGSTADGYIVSANAAWSTARGAADGSSCVNDVAKYGQVTPPYGAMEVYKVFANYRIKRGFFYFDTSSIPDAATITAATLSIYGYASASSDVSAQKGIQADTLTTADYDAFVGTSGDNDPDGREYGHVSWVVDQYNVITFNPTGKGDINKTGVTKICCREYTHDYSDSSPTGTNGNGCYFAEEGSIKRPKMDVTYSVASAVHLKTMGAQGGL